MKSTVVVVFPDARTAKLAARAVSQTKKSKRAVLKLRAKGNSLAAVVWAKDFSSLRALTTSLLRDLKVFIDSLKAAGK